MRVEIIIPNFNGLDLIKRNIENVLDAAEKQGNTSIVIVDDGSHIDEQKKLADFISGINEKNKVKINLMLYQQNAGFSTNVNRAGLISSSDIMVLLNTDVSPREDFLEPLLSHFKDNKVFGVGCLDESIETKTVLRGRGIGEWKRGFLQHRKGDVDKSDTFWVSGGSSALRTEVFKLLGGFDPLYDPFYWEDIDLSYRARKAGYTVLFEPRSIVVHVHKRGAIRKHYKDSVIKSYAMRNQITFVWKNITDKKLLMSHFLWLPYYLAYSVLKWDTIFLKGFFLAIARLPDIINHRNIQKKQFILRDKDLMINSDN